MNKKNRIVVLLDSIDKTLVLFIKSLVFIAEFFVLRNLFKTETGTKNELLLINTDKLGDIILSLDFLYSISSSNKYNKVYLIVPGELKALFQSVNVNIEIVPLNKSRYRYDLNYKIKFINSVRKLACETCLNYTPQRGFINEELTILSGAKQRICLNSDSPYLIKYNMYRLNRYYTKFFDFGNIKEYVKLANVLQFLDIDLTVCTKDIFIYHDSNFNFHSDKNRKTIGIAPFASSHIKDWGMKNFRELCELLSKDYTVVLFGTLKQKKHILKISEQRRNIYVNSGNLTLSALPEALEQCDLFIGNDSGLSHLALYTSTPLICLMGGGKDMTFFPYKNNIRTRFLYYKLDCFGCDWNCIYSESYCVSKIKVKTVYDSVLSLLEE